VGGGGGDVTFRLPSLSRQLRGVQQTHRKVPFLPSDENQYTFFAKYIEIIGRFSWENVLLVVKGRKGRLRSQHVQHSIQIIFTTPFHMKAVSRCVSLHRQICKNTHKNVSCGI